MGSRDVIVLCFGIHQPHGLAYCLNVLHRVRTQGITTEKGVVLVGCQMDRMYEDGHSDQGVMADNYERAQSISSRRNIPFIETSAKKGINIHSLFKQIVYEYRLQLQTQSIIWNDSRREST